MAGCQGWGVSDVDDPGVPDGDGTVPEDFLAPEGDDLGVFDEKVDQGCCSCSFLWIDGSVGFISTGGDVLRRVFGSRISENVQFILDPSFFLIHLLVRLFHDIIDRPV